MYPCAACLLRQASGSKAAKAGLSLVAAAVVLHCSTCACLSSAGVNNPCNTAPQSRFPVVEHRGVEDIIRGRGAVPATVAILAGRPHVGLTSEQLEALAKAGPRARKCSRRDLAVAIAQVGENCISSERKISILHRALKCGPHSRSLKPVLTTADPDKQRTQVDSRNKSCCTSSQRQPYPYTNLNGIRRVLRWRYNFSSEMVSE